MQEVSNVLTSAGYRIYAADNAAKEYGIIQEAISAAQEAAQHYAGAVYLTQAEYDALTPQQKMDATKVYFIEKEEESESE